MNDNHEEARPRTVLLAQSREQENPTVEVGTFFFEYRLPQPDQSLIDAWRRIYPLARRDLAHQDPCALQERRVDCTPLQRIAGEWRIIKFAPTVWEALWTCGALYNEGMQGEHPFYVFARDAEHRVREIDQELHRLTEQRLRDEFDARFRAATSRLRRPDRIKAIAVSLLQEYKQANQARLARVSALQTEQERLSTGVDAPPLESSEHSRPVSSHEPPFLHHVSEEPL